MSTTIDSHHRSSSLWDATTELVAAGQQVILDRVDLLRTEISDDARMVVVGSGLILIAGLVAAFGWVMSWLAVAVWLAERTSTPLALLVVGGLHLVARAVLGALAINRFRQLVPPAGLTEMPSRAE